MAKATGRKERDRGGIDELPSGSIRVRVYAGIDPVTKRRHDLTEIIPAGPDAKKLAEVAKVRLLNEVYQRRHPRTNATVDQMLERHFKDAELEYNTLETYKGYAEKHISPLLGKEKIGSLDAGVMDSFYAELRRCRDHCGSRRGLIDHRTTRAHTCDDRCRPHACKPLSASTIRQIHFIIRGGLRRAIKWKWITVNPIIDAEPPAPPRGNPKPPSSKQAALIVNEAFKDPDWGTLVWLTMVTGQRRGELCAIRWRHLDLDIGVLHLERAIGQRGKTKWEKDTKDHQDRRVTLDPDTVQLLRELLERRLAQAKLLDLSFTDDAYVFSRDPDGLRHLLPDSVGQRYRKLAERLGIKTSIHKLRHYSATELISAGVDVRTVAGRLGHGGGGTTTLKSYTAWVSEADQRAAGSLVARMPARPAASLAAVPQDFEPSSPYEQIAVELRDKILRGDLPAGLPLPAIKKLADEYNVASSTARRAVQLLSEWRLVEVVNGRPTLVRQLAGAADADAMAEPGDHLDAAVAGEALDLEVRRLGKSIKTMRAVADLTDAAQLQQLLSDAIRRAGEDESAIGDYELVVRYAGERGIATTFVAATPSRRLRSVEP